MPISSSTFIPTKNGNLQVKHHTFRINQKQETCISVSLGDIQEENCIVRVHSSCLFSEALGSIDCDCNLQLSKSLELIGKKGGVIIYL